MVAKYLVALFLLNNILKAADHVPRKVKTSNYFRNIKGKVILKMKRALGLKDQPKSNQ